MGNSVRSGLKRFQPDYHVRPLTEEPPAKKPAPVPSYTEVSKVAVSCSGLGNDSNNFDPPISEFSGQGSPETNKLTTTDISVIGDQPNQSGVNKIPPQTSDSCYIPIEH